MITSLQFTVYGLQFMYFADLGGKKFESIHLIDRIDSIDELNRFKKIAP